MDIKELIKEKESETLEFKERFEKEIFETVSAFANARGGNILIGITDKNKILGVTLGKETLNIWLNEILQVIEPKINISINSDKIDDKEIVGIFIPESPIKPISFKGRCYKRVNSMNKLLTPAEISELHMFSTGMSWDSLESNASLLDIDEKKFEDYIKLSKDSGRRKIKEKFETALRKLELLKKNPTWASILLFGKEPQRPLSQAQVHCGRFKVNKTQILDDLMIDGTIIEQVDKTMDFIKKHLKVEFKFEGIPRRKEVWEYPLLALREAVINSIIHRDYTIIANIQVEIYDDRIEIWNPGKLPVGITIKELYNKEHKSVIRNKLISNIFYDAGFIERYGSGTLRMIDLCKEQGLPSPEFTEISGGFMVVFRKDVFTEDYLKSIGLNERQISAVDYVKKKGKITNKEYKEINKISKPMATLELKEMVVKGIFNKMGITGRGTEYHIAKSKSTTMG